MVIAAPVIVRNEAKPVPVRQKTGAEQARERELAAAEGVLRVMTIGDVMVAPQSDVRRPRSRSWRWSGAPTRRQRKQRRLRQRPKRKRL